MAGHQLKAKVVRVTPTLAKDWLQTVVKQRPLHKPTVEHYARLIRDGQWVLHGQAIEFSSKGELINGQHRLHAIIATGKAVDCLVVRGTDPKAFDVIDTGRGRSARDILGIAGEHRVAALGGALAALYRYDTTGTRNLTNLRRSGVRPSNRDIENTLAAHPGIRDSLDKGYLVGLLLGSHGLSATLHYLMAEKDTTLTDLFFEQLATGENLNQREPAYHLREYLISQRNKRSKAPLQDRVFTFIKAWNILRSGRNASRNAIMWYGGKDEPAPTIE